MEQFSGLDLVGVVKGASGNFSQMIWYYLRWYAVLLKAYNLRNIYARHFERAYDLSAIQDVSHNYTRDTTFFTSILTPCSFSKYLESFNIICTSSLRTSFLFSKTPVLLWRSAGIFFTWPEDTWANPRILLRVTPSPDKSCQEVRRRCTNFFRILAQQSTSICS